MNIVRKMATVVRRLTLTNPDGWANPGSTSHANEPVTETSALALSAVWACVNLLSGTIASLPLMVYRTAPDGTRTVAKDHPLFRVLHDSPNADQTAADFWEYEVAGVELQGNAFARVARSGGRVVALHPVKPELVTVDRLPSGVLRYRWTEDGRAYEVLQDGMLHVRGFGGAPLGGMSTLAFGRHAFGLAMATDRAAGKTFANGLQPTVGFSFAGWLTKEQRAVAEQKMADKYLGAMNAGRPVILEGGTKIEPISIKPEDAQMLQSRSFSVEEICRFFGVPPHMIGHTEKTTSWGTGLEQQTLGFQKFTLRRRLKRIEQAIEKQLLSPQDRAAGITVEFNIEGLLRGDSAARAAFYNAGLNNGWLMINEVRALENLPPVEGGDVPRMQMQNVPISQAGAAPQENAP
ncbi:phage portal protein [Arenibaculum pallidiluteum]|uniref:phage portal protein n=1 Tax=Arenibaculum pallidiluteum TaxID=2812559 RepID=UPI001A969C33|nr:phage portal protein [Arenibaculum pallidiluteum]